MPIFTRRSIQLMLDELAPWLSPTKAKDLVFRLDSKDPDQAIPFEYELALTWAVSRVANLEIEKEVGRKAPDLYSPDLLATGPAHIEIAAISDESLSGQPVMRRAANIINGFAQSVAKGSHLHLHYRFMEESGYVAPKRLSPNWLQNRMRYFRRRKISAEFFLSDEMKTTLVAWLRESQPRGSLRLLNEHIDVVITWEDYVHPHGNTSSSMPSLAHDLKDNPLFTVLKRKEREQLRDVPDGVARCIFLGDAGCTLLRDIKSIWRSPYTVTGGEIIRNFLLESSIDLVCVFTPSRQNPHDMSGWNNPRVWQVQMFTSQGGPTEADCIKIDQIRSLLPPPYLEGYQARSWHEQGMLDPQGRGQYLAANWTSGKGPNRVRVSARGLQEYLAGRMTREQFDRFVDGGLFERELRAGKTISNVSLEGKGIDRDDDYVVFEFGDDPSAGPLRVPDLAEREEG